MPTNNEHIATKETVQIQEANEDYAFMLDGLGITYKGVDYYYQIRNITQTHGWILHITVIISQLSDLLSAILPELLQEKYPFRIARDRDTARCLQDGYFGIAKVGKVINVYLQDNVDALSLAKKLIKITSPFSGPAVPTGFPLGSIVFASYDSYEENFLQNHPGTTETVLMPTIPSGISWPFSELAVPELSKPPKTFKGLYRPVVTLKQDARGDVIKSLHLKSLFNVGNCIIKTGRKHMTSDMYGRDILSRLKWQKEVHEELSSAVLVPKIIDLFEVNGEDLLVMEYIKGISLHDQLCQVNFNSRSWKYITQEEKVVLLDYILEVIDIVIKLHAKGFVHRDIAPSNFLIDKKNRFFLIDLELAYCLTKDRPAPPFELGTPGFMSPEQQDVSIPTEKEDIYGLGGLMVAIFTGLSPVKFSIRNSNALLSNLYFFVGDMEISQLLTNCLDKDPGARPELSFIHSSIEKYRGLLPSSQAGINIKDSEDPDTYNPLDLNELERVIAGAIKGLTRPPMPISDNIWHSKTNNGDIIGMEHKEYFPYPWMHTGISGIIYTLSRVSILGCDISEAGNAYNESWEFIKKEYFGNITSLPGGFFYGTAGIALAASTGIRAGLIKNDELIRSSIKSCFTNVVSGIGLACGITGQAMALLQCIDLLDEPFALDVLDKTIASLLSTQQKNGAWLPEDLTADGYVSKNIFSFAHGLPGIIWFLLEFYERSFDEQVKTAAKRALKWINENTNDLKHLFIPGKFAKLIAKGGEAGDERTGLILTYMKAFKVMHENHYKDLAEEALRNYPVNLVNNTYAQFHGLAGLGELYLEAFTIFQNEEWKKRADWVTNVLIHTVHTRSDGSCYWLMNENFKPEADLMLGNSGIIHFLLRSRYPNKLGYRLYE